MHAIAFLRKYSQAYPLFIKDSVNLDRRLVRQSIPFQLYRDLSDENFKLELIYSPEYAQRFNKEVDFVNRFFEDGYQFHHVSPGVGNTNVPNADDIPVEFFVKLVYNYNKKIETLERIIQVIKTLIVLQMLKKLQFLNTILYKFTELKVVKNG